MKRRFRQLLVAGFVILIPNLAAAQNATFGTSVHLLVGQTPSRISLPTGSPTRYYDAPVTAKHSYCAEATASDTELNDANPSITVYRADQSTVLGVESAQLEPRGAGASRVCFIAPATETAYVEIAPASAAYENREYALRFVETTLWTNWFFVGADYSSFTLLRNTTSAAVTVDLVWRNEAGTVVAARPGQTVPANGVVCLDARHALGCAGAACATIAGSVEAAHNASPEAIVGSQTTLSGSTGLSFDTLLFQRRAW